MEARFAHRMIGLAAVAALCLTASGAQAAEGWSERGIFAFSGYALDFDLGYEAMARTYDLRDCSTAELYCGQGEFFALALPRQCAPLQEGDSWSHAGVTTEIVARDAEDGGFFLASPGDTSVLYRYEPSEGVTGMYSDRMRFGHHLQYDESQHTDLVQLAQDGELKARAVQYYLEDPQPGDHDAFYRPLTTFDPMGRCSP